MASVSELSAPHESHRELYSRWVATLKQHLQELQAALQSDINEADLASLVSRAQEHYRAYYRAKEGAVKQNVLQVMSPSWRSPLENAFLWLGGWRPTMVIQLAYAQAGRQLEAELADVLEGIDTLTMASLSSEQLAKTNDLQMKTQEREKELTQRMAILQQEIPDDLFLTIVRKEAAGESSQRGEARQGEEPNTAEAVMTGKLKLLENLLIDADILRYDTLDQVLQVLTVFQSAHYLLAAGYLQISIRRIGQSL